MNEQKTAFLKAIEEIEIANKPLMDKIRQERQEPNFKLIDACVVYMDTAGRNEIMLHGVPPEIEKSAIQAFRRIYHGL
jgi:hypothetical protein